MRQAGWWYCHIIDSEGNSAFVGPQICEDNDFGVIFYPWELVGSFCFIMTCSSTGLGATMPDSHFSLSLVIPFGLSFITTGATTA